ncbi:MAG TPA: glycosyltransferase [Alphaproteobacteria bacterium]|jgi:glycosyltransferase involved in cell wall biosynthesis
MKYLLVSETVTAGVGRHVASLAEGLHAKGFDTHILHGQQRIDPPFLTFCKKFCGRIYFASLPMSRQISLADIQSIFRVRRYIKKNGPFDIIHGHSAKGGAIARIAAIGLPSLKVYTPHAFPTMDPDIGLARRMFYTCIEWGLGQLTDVLIAVSPGEALHAKNKIRIPVAKIAMVPNGVSLSSVDFEPAEAMPFLDNFEGIKIVFVGRLWPQKAPERLLDVLAKLGNEGRPYKVWIIGEGPLQESLIQKQDELNLNKNIVWVGWQDARRFIHHFDLLVLTSKYETSPITLLEAGAAGTPILSMDVDGAELIIEQGYNGYLIPNGDIAAFAETLSTIINNSDELSRLKKNAASLKWTLSSDRMLEQTLSCYLNKPGHIGLALADHSSTYK